MRPKDQPCLRDRLIRRRGRRTMARGPWRSTGATAPPTAPSIRRRKARSAPSRHDVCRRRACTSVTVYVTDKDTATGHATLQRHRQQRGARRSPSAAPPASTRARAYSLTLGAVTDPGTDTVSSYIVHWGDGSSDTYTHRRRQDPHLRRRPQHHGDHGRPDRRGRHLPRSPPTRFSVTVNNVAPTIAIRGAASVNEGSAYSLTLGAVTDPGTDTVSSYVVHWGDGSSDTYTHRRRQDPHLRRRPEHPRDHGRPDRRGRHLPRRRQRASGHGQQRGARRSPSRGAASVNEGSAYSLTLGAVTDPGTDTVTQLHRPLGRRQLRHLHDRRRQDPHLRRRPQHYAITVDLIDEDGTFLDRPTRFSVTVNNVAPDDRHHAVPPASTRARPTA